MLSSPLLCVCFIYRRLWTGNSLCSAEHSEREHNQDKVNQSTEVLIGVYFMDYYLV